MVFAASNQPLTAVVSNGDAALRWLAATPPNSEKVRESLAHIVRSGKDAAEVVHCIRALFKGGKSEKLPLDMSGLVLEVLHLLQGETTRKCIAIETNLKNNLPEILGDRVQLQQVVLNLLLNAIESMDGVVGQPKTINVHAAFNSPGMIVVAVIDRGKGISDPARVFEPFFSTKASGMGMGLAICRSIIEAHDGRLWIEPCEVPGSKICFTLPAPGNTGI
ncbi:MAG: sensor histidine kinase [Acidobacteriaceae bacterium]